MLQMGIHTIASNKLNKGYQTWTVTQRQIEKRTSFMCTTLWASSNQCRCLLLAFLTSASQPCFATMPAIKDACCLTLRTTKPHQRAFFLWGSFILPHPSKAPSGHRCPCARDHMTGLFIHTLHEHMSYTRFPWQLQATKLATWQYMCFKRTLGCFLYGKVCKFILLNGLLVAEVAAVDLRLWAANAREPLLHSVHSVRSTLYDSLDGSPARVANPSAQPQLVGFILGVFPEENT